MNSCTDTGEERLQIRVYGDAALPALIYLPGLHGDWTLIASFRAAIAGHARFVEFTYPRTLMWSLADYASTIEAALLDHGITHGWLIGESFGSQIVWPLLEAQGKRTREHPGFTVDGVILAGGFVNHPFKSLVRLAERIARGVSLSLITRLLFGYAKFARIRYRRSPETQAEIQDFIARRTESDRHAAVHRLRLIIGSDAQPVARRTTVPVHALTGFWDPIVPWPFVLPWLKRCCPGYRGARIIGRADHNVLSTAPKESARQIFAWMNSAAAPSAANRAGTRGAGTGER